jgi:hypothetical protein
MARHSKPPKPVPLCVAELRLIVAKNLDNLISERFRQLATPQERFRALAERTGVGEETIRRFIREARSNDVPDLTLDKIALFADALQVRPSDLVTPFLAAQQLPAAARPQSGFVHDVPGAPPRRPASG